ncbi:MAG: Ig-like domain-containing protein [Candidatus Paceibacterota bacterium]
MKAKLVFYVLLVLFMYVGCQESPTESGADNTPPEIVMTNPQADENEVSIKTDIEIEFDEQISESTFFSIIDTSSNEVKVSTKINGKTLEVILSDSLNYSIKYTASVKATDLSGNEMEEMYSWKFTTLQKEKDDDEEDTSPPEVVNTIPENNDEEVSLSINLQVEFDERISDEVVFVLEDDSGNKFEGNGEVDWNLFTFIPSDELNHSSIYNVSIKASDLSGNEMEEMYSWSFETETKDESPPEVENFSPQDNSTSISVGVEPFITFNEDVDSQNSSIFMEDNLGNNNVDGDVNFNNKEISFIPKENLDYSTNYVVKVEASDLLGNKMSYSWSFETEQNPDNISPEVVSTTPEDNFVGASLYSIEIKMSEVIDASSVSSDNVWVKNDEGENLSYDVVVENEVIKLTLIETAYNSEIKPSSEYFAHVSGIKDLAGNVMQGSYEWSFFNKLWRVFYKSSNEVAGAVSGQDAVYFSGIFWKESNFIGFYIAKYNHEGKLEWIEELPGRTDGDFRDRLPTPSLNEALNELYFFTEKDKKVQFNRMNLQSREVITNPISYIEGIEKLSKVILIDDYLYVINGVTLVKLDRNGAKLAEFNFAGSGASSLTSNGSDLYVKTKHQNHDTIAKLDGNLDLLGLLNPDNIDNFPDEIRSVSALKGTDKQYIVGLKDDKPVIFVNDESKSEGTVINFGDIYDDVRYVSTVDDVGNVYLSIIRNSHQYLTKISSSGEVWRVGIGDTIPINLQFMSELDFVFISDMFSKNLFIYSSNGEKIN